MDIPAGWKLVPIHPTLEMLKAGEEADWVGEIESRCAILPDVGERWNEQTESYETYQRPGIWAAMISAAPPPPSQEK